MQGTKFTQCTEGTYGWFYALQQACAAPQLLSSYLAYAWLCWIYLMCKIHTALLTGCWDVATWYMCSSFDTAGLFLAEGVHHGAWSAATAWRRAGQAHARCGAHTFWHKWVQWHCTLLCMLSTRPASCCYAVITSIFPYLGVKHLGSPV